MLRLLLGDSGGQCVECVDMLCGDGGVLVDDEVVLGIDPLDAGHAAPRRVPEAGGFWLVNGQIGDHKEA